MANVIQIKRNTADAVPAALAAGELAHGEHINQKKLFIGTSGGNEVIGGLHYTDILDTVTNNTVLGRIAGTTGAVEELTATNLKTILGNPVESVGAGTLIDISGTGTAPVVDVDLSEATEAVYAPATDYLMFLDGGATGTAAKESGVDFATALAGVGLAATTGVMALDFTELTDMTADVAAGTEFILNDAGTESRKAASEIKLSVFNNDLSLSSGTVTSVTAGAGMTQSGVSTVNPTLDVIAATNGGLTVGANDIGIDYLGVDNFIDVATNLEGTAIATGDTIVYHDATDDNVKKGFVSDLPFVPSAYLDTDITLAADSDAKVATQKATKAYVDAAVTSSITYKGAYNAATNTPDLETPSAGAVFVGDMYTVTVAGEFTTGILLEIGDVLIAEIDDPAGIGDWTIVSRELDNASTTVYGITRLATSTEVANNTITDANDVITIGTLASNWIGSTNITTLGTVTTCTIDCGTYAV